MGSAEDWTSKLKQTKTKTLKEETESYLRQTSNFLFCLRMDL